MWKYLTWHSKPTKYASPLTARVLDTNKVERKPDKAHKQSYQKEDVICTRISLEG